MALAKALTSASPTSTETGRVDLIKIGNVLDTNLVTTDIVNQYIQWADADLNAKLSAIYATPIPMKANYETTLLGDIDFHHNQNIVLSAPGLFCIGDDILLSDGDNEERRVIVDITDDLVIETDYAIDYPFKADDTRVIRLVYPYPLTQCCARLAAANIYDKYFAAQSDPNVSEYGKFLRKQVLQDLDGLLNMTIILHGAMRIQRFFNANLAQGATWGTKRQGEKVEIKDI